MGLTLTDAKRRILSLLDEEPRHGYVLAKELGVQGSTVYEHLRKLENAGYIDAEQDRRRKIYSLTKRGKLIIEAENIEDS